MTPSVKRSPLLSRLTPWRMVDAVGAARPLHRPFAHREDHAVALAEAHDLGARLHARPLLGQHELAAGKVALRARRAGSRPGAERDARRRRPGAGNCSRPAHSAAEAASAASGPRRGSGHGRPRARRGSGPSTPIAAFQRSATGASRAVEAAPQPDDQVRQRIGEIFVLAPAEAMGSPSRCASGTARRPA